MMDDCSKSKQREGGHCKAIEIRRYGVHRDTKEKKYSIRKGTTDNRVVPTKFC